MECNHDARRLTIRRDGILNVDDLVDSVIKMRAMDIWSYRGRVDARQVKAVNVSTAARYTKRKNTEHEGTKEACSSWLRGWHVSLYFLCVLCGENFESVPYFVTTPQAMRAPAFPAGSPL